MHLHKEEKIGEWFIIGQNVFAGLFPILINYSVKITPPIFFAGITSVLAGLCLIPFVISKKNIQKMREKRVLKDLLGVMTFIVFIPSILIFLGAQLTSSVNTALLLQTEIIFAFIICGLLKYEKITQRKVLGAIIITFGAIAILYNGKLSLSLGDILITGAGLFFPFGNIFAKRALKEVSPTTVIFFRAFVGGIILLLISFLFEATFIKSFSLIKENIWPIAINGILISCISKIFWYEGLRRIDLTKAVALGTSAPAFSLIFAFLWLKEVPTIYQIVGFTFIMIGLFVTTQKSRLQTVPYGQ